MRCRCRTVGGPGDAARWVDRVPELEASLWPFNAATVARSIAKGEADAADRMGARFDKLDAALERLEANQDADRRVAELAYQYGVQFAQDQRRAAEEARSAAEEARSAAEEARRRAEAAADQARRGSGPPRCGGRREAGPSPGGGRREAGPPRCGGRREAGPPRCGCLLYTSPSPRD